MGSAQQLYVDLSNRNAFKRLNYKTGNILFRVTEKRLCWKGSIPALFKLLCVSTEQLSTGRAAPQAPLSDEHLQPSSASGFFVPSSLSPAPTVTLISTFRFFSSFRVASTYYRTPGMKVFKTHQIKPRAHNTAAASLQPQCLPYAACWDVQCHRALSPSPVSCSHSRSCSSPGPPTPVPPTAACTGSGGTARVTAQPAASSPPPDSTASYWKCCTAGKETAK